MINKKNIKSDTIPDKKKYNLMRIHQSENTNNKITELLDYIKTLKHDGFTGYLKINFSQGGIARVERFEEILKQ